MRSIRVTSVGFGGINTFQGCRVGSARPAARTLVAGRSEAAGTIVRRSNAAGRQRAARMVAEGDRRLREADQDPNHLRTALAHYRRAAAAAQDQPDTLIRQAIVHSALGEFDEAERVLGRVAAIDARLTDGRLTDARLTDARLAHLAAPVRPAAVADRPLDPVFGEGKNASTALADRGRAVLAAIASGEGAGVPGPLTARFAGLSAGWSALLGRAPVAEMAQAERPAFPDDPILSFGLE
jgi:hypothetical protein